MNIVMGNDEFILYIRKRYPNCSMSNDVLGRRIWEWIRGQDGRKEEEDMPCYWGDTGAFVSEDKLPKTATQFSFGNNILPRLYEFLNQLGTDG